MAVGGKESFFPSTRWPWVMLHYPVNSTEVKELSSEQKKSSVDRVPPTTSSNVFTLKREDLKRNIQSFLTFLLPFVGIWLLTFSIISQPEEFTPNRTQCFNSCSLRVVESIPDNITFHGGYIPPTTFYAWKRLIKLAKNDMYIAAYKSSLQGKHVLGSLSDIYSREGNDVYSAMLTAGTAGKIKIHMVENYPPKDVGDNADGIILQDIGAVERRSLDIEKVLGRGKFHSKFLLSDNKHFYLGSANLDWRSLNQKMELGVLVENCDCLGEDLKRIFSVYWALKENQEPEDIEPSAALYSMNEPLDIQIDGEKSEVYLATSPKELNGPGRTWDLDAIVAEIDNAKKFLDIHVMDYFPLFIYKKPKTLFPAIDDALRRAVVRGVKVRILAAALHYPQMGTRFLRSLQSLNEINANATITVKIFKVPPLHDYHKVISRERRTHNKFMVSESTVLIGTSNWSGDYFVGGTTGAAVVIKQRGAKKAMIRQMKGIFERDWESEYAHDLEEYYQHCIMETTANYCEGEKDPSLFAKPQYIDM